MKHLLALLSFALVLVAAEPPKGEPTNAKEAAAKKAAQDAAVEVKYQALVAQLSPEEQAWEKVLQANLGNGFYLPLHKRGKIAGQSSAWDFVKDDPKHRASYSSGIPFRVATPSQRARPLRVRRTSIAPPLIAAPPLQA